MRAVGLTDQLRAASEAEVNAKTPLTDAIRNDPAQMAAREQQIDEATDAKLQANAARFVELFGDRRRPAAGFLCDGRPGAVLRQRRTDSQLACARAAATSASD